MPSTIACGILLDEQAIFECSRLALVGIADQIFRLGAILRARSSTSCRWETRAAAPAQTRSFDFFDQLLRLQVSDHFLPRSIAATRLIGRQRVRIRNIDIA